MTARAAEMSAYHENDAAHVHAVCEELGQVLLNSGNGGGENLVENGLVARPEVVTKQVF
jgi:hypothetical protein